uniref:Uncharacterized protein n=1 Tax=Arundo donax TaxID=35708 RepID=A0A0A9BM95_ARUDO
MAYRLKEHSHLFLNGAMPSIPESIDRTKFGAELEKYMLTHSKKIDTI